MIKILSFFLLIPLISFSQKKIILTDSISLKNSFELDLRGNLLSYNSDSIQKFDSKLNHLFSFDYSTIGTIKTIQATNGLKLFVFDQNNRKLIFLDNTLSIQKELEIPFEIGNVSEVYWSKDGFFWMYFQDENKVKKFSESFELLFDSGNLELLCDFKPSNSVHIKSFNSNLLFDSGKDKQVIFDLNGAFINSLNINSNPFFVETIGEYLVSHTKNQLDFYKLGEVSITSIPIDKKIEKFKLFESKLYLLSKNILYIYKVH